MLPKIAQATAANISGYGNHADDRQRRDMHRQRGQQRQERDQRHHRSTRLTPRPCIVPEKRMVSSCTRCEAPSMVRSRGQFAV